MCGICGQYNFREPKPVDVATVEVTNGTEKDVISFDPATQQPATLIVNAVPQGALPRGPLPPSNVRLVAQ